MGWDWLTDWIFGRKIPPRCCRNFHKLFFVVDFLIFLSLLFTFLCVSVSFSSSLNFVFLSFFFFCVRFKEVSKEVREEKFGKVISFWRRESKKKLFLCRRFFSQTLLTCRTATPTVWNAQTVHKKFSTWQ